MHLMCCNDAIGLEWVLCVCLAQFWSVQLNVLTLQCCLLHPSHQQVSLPVHQLHYLTSQFAVMLLVGGKGGLIVCVCVRAEGRVHYMNPAASFHRVLDCLSMAKKLCCMPSNLANIIIVDAYELTMTSSSNNKSTQTIIWVPCADTTRSRSPQTCPACS